MKYDKDSNVHRLEPLDIERLRKLKVAQGPDFRVTYFIPDEIQDGQGFKIGSCFYSERHDPISFVRISDIIDLRFTISLGELPL